MYLNDYPKVKRIPITGIRIRGKRYATEDDIELLLSGEVFVEEKVDGKHYWETFPGYERYQFFYEYMKVRHSILYTCLPSWKLYFDVWDSEEERFLNYEDKSALFEELGLHSPPLLWRGRLDSVEELLNFLGTPSAFGAPKIEGILVKRYDEPQLFLKVVDPEFEDIVDESGHYLRRKKEYNRIGFC